MGKIRVELGAASYDICIARGIAAELGEFLRQANYSAKALLITDEKVHAAHGARVAEIFEEAGMDLRTAILGGGERMKSLAQAEELFTAAIGHGMDRKSPVVALGGGVVGDLAGFVAATYMRGVPFLQLPTSLLAQVDSSVGGKVAVNHPLGKNLIGAFYQPDAVFIDLDFLDTLPAREISTGLGEIVKYGAIYSPSLYQKLESAPQKVLALDGETIAAMVAESCAIKAEVVRIDEKEGGLRRILNFGHTIAHAIESETHYERYNHGEAVAIGMVGAARISAAMGLLDAAEVLRMERILTALKLPTRAEGCTLESMYSSIFHDKKAVAGKVHWVLLERIGKTRVTADVTEDAVKQAMANCLA